MRALRRSGWTPANIFGPGTPSVAIELQTREMEHLLTHVPRNALVALAVQGAEEVTVLIKGVERRATTDELFHVDFYRVSMTHALKASVPLVVVGEAPAVDQYDATILRELDALPVECLPGDLPVEILVDISGLAEIGDAIHIRDLPIPAGVTSLLGADDLVVHAVGPRIEVEEVPEEAAEEAAAAAEAPAEAGTEAAGEQPSEASEEKPVGEEPKG